MLFKCNHRCEMNSQFSLINNSFSFCADVMALTEVISKLSAAEVAGKQEIYLNIIKYVQLEDFQ